MIIILVQLLLLTNNNADNNYGNYFCNIVSTSMITLIMFCSGSAPGLSLLSFMKPNMPFLTLRMKREAHCRN